MKDSDESEIDALFQLPLNEFTAARNALASRLKKAGRDDKAAKVKALAKPSVPAWAVNQLYWNHKDAFDRVMTSGRRFIEAQMSQLAGKAADTDQAQTEQRKDLSVLSRLADALLREAGYKATPDMVRRINTTLEAVSTYSSISHTQPPGRLTADVNPPGFESLAALIPPAGPAQRPTKSKQVIPFKPPRKTGARKQEDKADAESTSAKTAALHAAEQVLQEAQKAAAELAAAQEKAATRVHEAEKLRLEAEERYQQARHAEEEARKRLHSVTAESEKAARALDDAATAVQKARNAIK